MYTAGWMQLGTVTGSSLTQPKVAAEACGAGRSSTSGPDQVHLLAEPGCLVGFMGFRVSHVLIRVLKFKFQVSIGTIKNGHGSSNWTGTYPAAMRLRMRCA